MPGQQRAGRHHRAPAVPADRQTAQGTTKNEPERCECEQKERPCRISVTNIVVAGLGGQGVLKATDILADVAFRAGFDVKKSEIKGMSQRGGSVTSDVRFGDAGVQPDGADAARRISCWCSSPTQVEPHRHYLQPGGVLITPDAVDANQAAEQEEPERRAARRVERAPAHAAGWLAGSRCAPVSLRSFFEANRQAFLVGRRTGRNPRPTETTMSKQTQPAPMHPASAMDFLPLPQLRDIQFARLKAMVSRAYDRVAAVPPAHGRAQPQTGRHASRSTTSPSCRSR